MYLKKNISLQSTSLSKSLVNCEQGISPTKTRNCGKPVKFDTPLNLELLKRYVKISNLELYPQN